MELSERLEEILKLICEGLTNYQIARRRGILETTVKNYATQLYAKLGVRNRVEAILWGRAHGYGKQGDTKILPFHKLTVLQAEVASYVAKTMENTEIAKQLGVSVGVIESRLHRVAIHVGESRRVEIAAAYLKFVERYPYFSWHDAEKDPDRAVYWGRVNGFGKELPSELPFDKLESTELEVVQYFAQGKTRAEILSITGFKKEWLNRCLRRIYKYLGECNRYVIADVYNSYKKSPDVEFNEQGQEDLIGEQTQPSSLYWLEAPGDLALLRQFLDILDLLCRDMSMQQVGRKLDLHRRKVAEIIRYFYPWLGVKSLDELIYKGRLHNLGKELPASLPFDVLKANELDLVRCIALHMADAEIKKELELSTDQLDRQLRKFRRLLGEPNRHVIAHVYNELKESPVAKEAPVLAPKLQEVLVLLCQGLPNFKIGQQLGVSEHTVKTHCQRLYGKLGVKGRTGAVEWARANGFDVASTPELPFEILDQQELRLVRCVADGMKNAEIAIEIGVKDFTAVERKLSYVRDKLGERSRYKIAAAYKEYLKTHPNN